MSQMPLRLLTFVVGILVSALFLSDSASRLAVGQPSHSEVVAKLKEGRASFQNAFAVTRWVEVWDGTPKTWERQRWTWDHLGRRRLSYQYGRIDDRGRELPPDEALEVDSLFDGEVVLDQRFYPHRDRLGGSDDKLPKGYRAAIVSDAAAPAREALESHRNPHEYLRNVAMRELEQCLAEERPVTIQETDGLLELSYGLRGVNSGSTAARSVIIIDPDQGWSLLRWTAFDSSSKIVSEIAVSLEESNGQWIATEGSHKHWGDRPTDSAPIFDWRFEVTEFVLDDPDFDDRIFAVHLLPDTAVSDTRFKAVYRIGAAEASAEDLVRLAELARAEAPRARPAGPAGSPQPRPMTRILLIFNVLAIASVILFLITRRLRRA